MTMEKQEEDYLKVLSCETVSQWSTDILKISQKNDDEGFINLIIPGNPGVVSYYELFCEELYKEFGGNSSVWAVSHTCHTKEDNTPNANLRREVDHKVDLLTNHIPKHSRLRLIGHSIGCWMILETLRVLSEKNKHVYNRIECCYLLFPTVERMKDSPRGQSLWPFLAHYSWLPLTLASAFSYLPLWIREKLIKYYLSSEVAIHNCILDGVLTTLRSDILSNILTLAHQELLEVTDMDTDLIDEHKDKLVFYYGTTDGWVPLSYKDDLVSRVPDVRVYTCGKKIDHAFVVQSSKAMAEELQKLVAGDL